MNGRLGLVCGVAAPLAVLAAFAAAHALVAPPLMENVTPSMPLGLYRHVDQAVQVGRIVAVRQPAAGRGYLHTLGFPAAAPLLKRVAAAAGDKVCAGDGVRLPDGRRLTRVTRDRLGTRLPYWSGCRRLTSDELWLVGDDSRSFDSRYFGPVSKQNVVGVYERVS